MEHMWQCMWHATEPLRTLYRKCKRGIPYTFALSKISVQYMAILKLVWHLTKSCQCSFHYFWLLRNRFWTSQNFCKINSARSVAPQKWRRSTLIDDIGGVSPAVKRRTVKGRLVQTFLLSYWNITLLQLCALKDRHKILNSTNSLLHPIHLHSRLGFKNITSEVPVEEPTVQ